MIRRNTPHKELIKEILVAGYHPTAEEVHEAVKEKLPKASLGTIYRNLTILKEERAINCIDFGAPFERFDGNVKPHYHFACTQCHQLIDIEVPYDYALNEMAKQLTDHAIEGHQITFQGVCKACKHKTKTKTKSVI